MTADASLPLATAEPAPAGALPQPPPDHAGLQLVFDLDQPALAAVVSSLTQWAGKRPLVRRERLVAWDGPGRRLAQAGYCLIEWIQGQRRQQRLRPIGAAPAGGRWLVTDSSPLAAGVSFDLSRIAFLPGVEPALVARLAAAPLEPVFGIEATRTQWRYQAGEVEVRIAIECGAIQAAGLQATGTGGGIRPFCQVTLEWLAGPATGLYDLARRLVAAHRLTLAAADAVQIGWALATGTEPPGIAIEPRLDETMTLRAGILAIGRAASAEVRAALAGVALDPGGREPVHRARVALRRLRSILSVFAPALPRAPRRHLSRALGTLAQRLGAAREWDVFIETTLDPLAGATAAPGIERLKHTAGIYREQASAAVAPALAGFAQLSLELGAWFDAGLWPVPPTPDEQGLLERRLGAVARDLLRRRHRRLVGDEAALSEPDPAELHRLRLDAKKLRYTVEFFRPLFPAKPTRRYLDHLRQVQDVLGSVNDAAAARGLVQRLGAGEGAAGGMVLGWSAAEGAAARERFRAAWRSFKRTKRFWRD